MARRNFLGCFCANEVHSPATTSTTASPTTPAAPPTTPAAPPTTPAAPPTTPAAPPTTPAAPPPTTSPGDSTLQSFRYHELVAWTNNFAVVLGRGGSSTVFRGQLPDGRQIAVKTLRQADDAQRLFQTEISILCAISHPNVVHLIGFCREDSHLILVYDFVDPNTLRTRLHDCQGSLEWDERLQIAGGVAAALAFLHQLTPPVVHRDVKPDNILVDPLFNAKLTDFGISRHAPREATPMAGTFGYMDPATYASGTITPETDIYSFGVLLLELISGRKGLDEARPDSEQSVVDWALPFLKSRRYEDLVDSNLRVCSNEFPREVLVLAERCLSYRRRPSMDMVAKALSVIRELSLLFGHSQDEARSLQRQWVEAFQGSQEDIHAGSRSHSI